MKLGTKTLLFGFHQFLLHPLIVARAWWILYGLPLDPRLWLAFLVHDWGYWGKPKLDDADGETHPLLGAKIMSVFGQEWSDLVLLHSRFYAKSLNREPSMLCYADKLGICLYPYWLWRFLVCATGEIDEYLAAQKYIEESQGFTRAQLRQKYDAMVEYLQGYVFEHAPLPE